MKLGGARRVVASFAIVTTASLALPLSVIAWDASCVSGDVCIWRDRDFGLPVATQTGSNGNYGTAKYPNTTHDINDSASSVANYYTSRDVVFYHGTNGSGSSFCVDSWYQYSWVGLLNNDAFSSHSVTADDALCP